MNLKEAADVLERFADERRPMDEKERAENWAMRLGVTALLRMNRLDEVSRELAAMPRSWGTK